MSDKRQENYSVDGRTFVMREMGYARAGRCGKLEAKFSEERAKDLFSDETIQAMALVCKELLGDPVEGPPVDVAWYGDLSMRQYEEIAAIQARLQDATEAKKNWPDGQEPSPEMAAGAAI